MTIDERLTSLLQSTNSLHSTVQDLTEQIAQLVRLAERDGENIRRLTPVEEPHEDTFDALDGGT